MADSTTKITAGTAIAFKTGSQSNLDTLKAKTAGGIPGCFYLTDDTHKLYIGNKDKTISLLSSGVVFVQNSSGLPTSTDNIEKEQLYYVVADNKLLRFDSVETTDDGGSKVIWKTINSQSDYKMANATTNTQDTVIDSTVAADSQKTMATVTTTDTDSTGKSFSHTYAITGDNGVTVVADTVTKTTASGTTTVPSIKITGDTYTLSSAVKSNGTNPGVTLNLDSTANDSSVDILPVAYDATHTAVNAVFSRDTDGTIKIGVKDSQISSTTVSNAASSGNGFVVTVTDNFGKSTTGGAVDPIIVVNSGSTEHHFVDGKLDLTDVYTKNQVDEKFTGLNAMHYIGTVGEDGSYAAATILNASGEIVGLKDSSNKELTTGVFSNGDTLLVSTAVRIGTAGYVNPGSLLIAQGDEDTTVGSATYGKIISNLKFAVVNETLDTDTQYMLVAKENGVSLQTKGTSGKNVGSIVVKGTASGTSTTSSNAVDKSSTSTNSGVVFDNDTGITVTSGTSDTTAPTDGSVNRVLTVSHNEVTRTDSKATGVQTEYDTFKYTNPTTNQGHLALQVVTGVDTDKTGHVVGVNTTTYDIHDTNASMDSVGTTTSVSTATDSTTKVTTNTATLATTVALKSWTGAQSSKSSNNYISSETLNITATKSSGASSNDGLKIDLVWGDFDSLV